MKFSRKIKVDETNKGKVLFTKFLILSFLALFLLPSLVLPSQAKKSNDENELVNNDTHLALNSYQSKLSAVKENAASLRRKVSSARHKEQLALAQLQKTQRELYRIQTNFIANQRRLIDIQRDIEKAQSEINSIDKQVYSQTAALRLSLRGMYVHKADIIATLIDSVFQSKSIIELFNVLYYNKRFIGKQLSYIREIREKQIKLRNLQREWAERKSDLGDTLKKSERLRESVAHKKEEQYGLVDRLRKERLAYEAAERQLERESNQLTSTILKLSKGSGVDLDDLIKNYFDFPVRAAITSPFGYRMHPIFRVRSFHSGVDLGARHGTPIKASNGGLIIYAGWYSGYGKTVIVSHNNGKSTLYAHMDRLNVANGDKVCQGQVIGYVGSTGYSTGPHLHFEYRYNGQPQNPLAVLR
jgi:murein DD-endopeptidase MepM/ murein hydrolase activator NlpD